MSHWFDTPTRDMDDSHLRNSRQVGLDKIREYQDKLDETEDWKTRTIEHYETKIDEYQQAVANVEKELDKRGLKYVDA